MFKFLHSCSSIVLGKLGKFQVNINSVVLIILSKICLEYHKLHHVEPSLLLKCFICSVVFASGSHPCQQEWFSSILKTHCVYYQLLWCHLAHQSRMMEIAAVPKQWKSIPPWHTNLPKKISLYLLTWLIKYSDFWRRTLHGIICACACTHAHHAHIAVLWELLESCLATQEWETGCTHISSDHTNSDW